MRIGDENVDFSKSQPELANYFYSLAEKYQYQHSYREAWEFYRLALYFYHDYGLDVSLAQKLYHYSMYAYFMGLEACAHRAAVLSIAVDKIFKENFIRYYRGVEKLDEITDSSYRRLLLERSWHYGHIELDLRDGQSGTNKSYAMAYRYHLLKQGTAVPFAMDVHDTREFPQGCIQTYLRAGCQLIKKGLSLDENEIRTGLAELLQEICRTAEC